MALVSFWGFESTSTHFNGTNWLLLNTSSFLFFMQLGLFSEQEKPMEVLWNLRAIAQTRPCSYILWTAAFGKRRRKLWLSDQYFNDQVVFHFLSHYVFRMNESQTSLSLTKCCCPQFTQKKFFAGWKMTEGKVYVKKSIHAVIRSCTGVSTRKT